jgi:hypothetical protein
LRVTAPLGESTHLATFRVRALVLPPPASQHMTRGEVAA